MLAAETRYHPSADQLALASTIEESFDVLLPLPRLHSALEEDPRVWASLQELGLFGITLGEEQGGSGLGAVEEALIAMQLGRRLAAPSVLATLGVAHAAQSKPSSPERTAAAYRRGSRTILINDTHATQVLVRDANGATLYALLDGPGRTVDRRLWLAELREITTPDAPIARFEPAQVLRLRLLDAALLAGMAAAALDMSVSYAGIRQQFGRPIGSFQAIKHHCANMAMAARCARDQTSFAAVAFDNGRDDAALQIECAFFVAGTAALENAGKNIQIHGGIGFSDEADPHLFLKRAQLQLAIAGGLEAANARIANMKASW